MMMLCKQIWKTQTWPQDWKKSVFTPIPKKTSVKALLKAMLKYHKIAFNSHTRKVTCKVLQARLQQHVNQELPDVQTGFRKGRGTRDQIANICWFIKKESSRKTSTSALMTTPKPLSVWNTTVETSSKDRNTRPPYLPPEKPVCRSRSNS